MIATQQACRSLERDQCIYTSCYCEENVYKLLQSLLSDGIPAECLFAVFISNSNETVSDLLGMLALMLSHGR